MKAMVLNEFGGPIVLQDIERPRCGPSDAVIEVGACGICGSDLKIRKGKIPGVTVPRVLGHEVAGTVVEVGSEIGFLHEGDRVVASLYLTCGRCEFCLSGRDTLCINLFGQVGEHIDGGLAEYMRVPAANLFKLSSDVPFEQASVLADAVGSSYHALTAKASVRPGDTVLVVGAGGGLGLHAVQIAKLHGAKVLAVDIEEVRLKMAREQGADELLNAKDTALPDWVKKVTDGKGADVIIELIGSGGSLATAISCLKRGGRLVVTGYQFDSPFHIEPFNILANEYEVVGSRNTTKKELEEIIRLVEAGMIKPVITRTFPMEEIDEAHRLLEEGKILARAVAVP